MTDEQKFIARAEQIAGAKFNAEAVEYTKRVYAEMQKEMELIKAEADARAYARRKKMGNADFNADADNNLTSDVLDATDGTADDPHIAARIRRWAKRTSRTKFFGENQ